MRRQLVFLFVTGHDERPWAREVWRAASAAILSASVVTQLQLLQTCYTARPNAG